MKTFWFMFRHYFALNMFAFGMFVYTLNMQTPNHYVHLNRVADLTQHVVSGKMYP